MFMIFTRRRTLTFDPDLSLSLFFCWGSFVASLRFIGDTHTHTQKNKILTNLIPTHKTVFSLTHAHKHKKRTDGYIAQWLERLTADQQVPGSNPGVPFG